jgi:hypothetical protein
MSINVMRETAPIANMSTHCVGSTGAPSRRTVFIRGTNTKVGEIPKIAGRNKKANIFQKGSAGFKATVDLNKKKTA